MELVISIQNLFHFISHSNAFELTRITLLELKFLEFLNLLLEGYIENNVL